jgi:hypothetical protein
VTTVKHGRGAPTTARLRRSVAIGYKPAMVARPMAAALALLGLTCSARAHPPATQTPAQQQTKPTATAMAPTSAATGTVPDPIRIVDLPIHFGPERVALTLSYRRRHSNPGATDIRIEPRAIVVHITESTTLREAFRYFDRDTIENERAQLKRAGDVNVSAHFLVDRDGGIYRLMDETTMARHTIGLNHVAIGIENVANLSSAPLTPAQLTSNAALVRYLVAKYPITHLLGHHEYLRMQGHPYWSERDPAYRTIKSDPGPAFMAALRSRLGDLALQEPPSDKRPASAATGDSRAKR